MNLEIERKFLVRGDFLPFATSSTRIVQGYLNSHPERSVRVRIRAERAFLTIKGIGNASGLARFEWEREISREEAESLLPLCEPGLIDKTRYLVPGGPHQFEVDVFRGGNEGLIIAEIELQSEDEPFLRPDWLGEEVTSDPRYFNSALVKRPYQEW